MVAKISMKGLAQFVLANPARQRKILRDFKYPDKGDAKAQIPYYSRARQAIGTFYRSGHAPNWLLVRANNIRFSPAASKSPQSKTICEYNARALESYHKYFVNKTFQCEEALRTQTSIAKVQVNVNPELHVFEKSRRRVIHVEFAVDIPNRQEFLKIASQIMFEVVSKRFPGLGLSSTDVMSYDVKDGSIYKAKVRVGIRNQIVAACQNIATIWPTI